MPLKLKHIFEKEYGKKKGDRIFYAWENKHGHHYPKKTGLVLTGNKRYITHMFKHLKSEHPSTRRRMRMI